MSTRRERGFVGMNEVLSIGGVIMLLTVVMIPAYLARVQRPGVVFFVACVGAVAVFVALMIAILDRIPYHDPGSLGCFALWLPQVLAIGGGGFGAVALADHAGLASSAHWFALAGGLAGMAAYAAGVRLLLRKRP